MKHKTADLVGDLLDAAVAKANGMHPYFGRSPRSIEPPAPEIWRDACGWPIPKFSSSWSDGGPLIESHSWVLPRVNTNPGALHRGKFAASTPAGFDHYGPTPLIAAMRAYIASKFGDEVELPGQTRAERIAQLEAKRDAFLAEDRDLLP